MTPEFTIRVAKLADIPAITSLMQAVIRVNMKPFLSPAEIKAAAETMGVDETLINDGTYFVVEFGDEIAACGGWGKHKTLYGGSNAPTQDNALLDPDTDAARIRAMYTDPDHTRKGLASMILEHGEAAAQEAGFRMIELGSTIAGQKFYKAHGYLAYDTHTHIASNGTAKTTILMRKTLGI